MNTSQDVYHPLVPAIMGYARDNGIKEELFSDPLARENQPFQSPSLHLTSKQLQLLGKNIVDATEDPCPGLHIGENLSWANVGIVGYIVLNSRNVLEGLKRFNAYYQMVSNITTFRIATSPQHIELCWQPNDDRLVRNHRLILEGILASLKPLLEEQTGQTVKPVEIQFCWPAPGDLSAYKRVFDTRLSFNQPYIKAVFDRKIGQLPCRIPNAEMLTVLETYIRDRCHQQCASSPFSSEVLTVLKNCEGFIPGIEQVAEKRGISVRSLQMKLKKEGATFRSLRDQTLCGQARLFLTNSRYSVERISSLLGFSEPAVFYRNFKRWTGQTPREYRSSTISTV
jgi:AraC-like DNA-binding protein